MAVKLFDEILEESLNMLRAGVGVDDCVAPYPALAPRLREQLAMAQTLWAAQAQPWPDADALTRGRSNLLAAVQREAARSSEPALGLVTPLRLMSSGFRRLAVVPYALPAVAAMVILGGAAIGVAASTGNSNPRGWFGSAASDHDEVEVRGTVTALDATAITITAASGDAVTAQITPETEFEADDETPLTIADFAVGDFVKLEAFRDENGTLIAREVEREEEEVATPAADNQGPGNAEDDDADDDADEEEHDDNSGPGNADDLGDDNSGPGNTDDSHDDNSGPGNAEDPDGDNSGPGGGDDGHEGTDDNSGPGSSGSVDDDHSGDDSGSSDSDSGSSHDEDGGIE